jgi:hypothetical protein
MEKTIYDFIIVGNELTLFTAGFCLHEGESFLPFCNALFKEMGTFDEIRKHFVKNSVFRLQAVHGSTLLIP